MKKEFRRTIIDDLVHKTAAEDKFSPWAGELSSTQDRGRHRSDCVRQQFRPGRPSTKFDDLTEKRTMPAQWPMSTRTALPVAWAGCSTCRATFPLRQMTTCGQSPLTLSGISHGAFSDAKFRVSGGVLDPSGSFPLAANVRLCPLSTHLLSTLQFEVIQHERHKGSKSSFPF